VEMAVSKLAVMIELSFSAIVFLETVNEAAGLLRFSIDRVIF
jgi:hypothetical protein